MFQVVKEVTLLHGNPSCFPRNLSTLYNEDENETLGCVVSKNIVQVIKWDDTEDMILYDPINVKKSTSDKNIIVTQAAVVFPDSRNSPVVVVCTCQNVTIYDAKTGKSMLCTALPEGNEETSRYNFGKGITFLDNNIFVGTDKGDIIYIYCSSDSNFVVKKSIIEHRHPIMDLATCKFDLITVSCDSSGLVCIWSKGFKTPKSRISTNLKINVINILRKHVICGTFSGQCFFYSIQTGELKAEVNCNCRSINSISVAPESAYILIAGEDGVMTVWKLHTRKPEPFQVEWRFNEIVESSIIVGADFANTRGNVFVVACYDEPKIKMFRIVKKQPSTGVSK
uniref:Cilia- and flagella-associated protein 52 n=1 Tax=Strongyloides venezuelensis TaxID=75913 RepID=A0A0K0FIP6_STRVS